MTKLTQALRPSVLGLLVALATLPTPCAAAAPTARIDVAGLETPVTVTRDSNGIPHIYADNEHDLYFMQGWIHAEDRLFQMDLSRRQASGTLAELLGEAALGSDVQLRTLGLRRAAELSLDALSPEAQSQLAAYAEGVNAWIASHSLPPEYSALEITTFSPWTPVDSVVIAKLIAFSLSFDLDIDATLTLAAYEATGDAIGFDGVGLFLADLSRSAPFDPASTVPDATAGAGTVAGASATASTAALSAAALSRGVSRLSPATLDLARDYAERARRVPLLARALQPAEDFQGSNEWAVSGAHTANGRPLLANDPHLALGTPATFHQIHLRCPACRVDVHGSGFPGAPYVILGQNRRITWGATTNPMDVTDVYQEQVVGDTSSPSGLATVYFGQPEPILPLPELFRYNTFDGAPDTLTVAPPDGQVSGTFIPSATLIVPRRNQGPILSLDVANGTALSVQYTGFSATREIDAFRIWNLARNLDEFRRGLDYFDYGSQNFAYADIHGNIAYFTSAEMPLREDLQAGVVDGLPPFFIRYGNAGNEWLPAGTDRPEHQAVPFQVLPADEMPHVINPAAGWFVNANNDPAGTTLDNDPLNQLRPGGGIFYLSAGYAQGTRAGRITARLRELVARGDVTAADLQSVQADTVMLDAQVFVPYILAAYESMGGAFPPGGPSPAMTEAVERLREWDYTTPTGIDIGFDASDVDGVRLPAGDEEIAASVAATIYSVWRSRMIRNTVDATLAPFDLQTPGSRNAIIALRWLLEGFEVHGGLGASGLDFFAQGQGATAAERRDWLLLQSLAEALDRLAGADFQDAFGGSHNLDAYRWGRLHRIVFEHPLGGPFSIPPAGGAFVPANHPRLPGVAVDGGFGVVDASSHSVRADSVNDFMFGSGPVRRYVGHPGVAPGSIEGWTSMPGGESGVLGNPFYFNLLPRWLTNDVYPMRQRHDDVQADVLVRYIYRPKR